MPILLLIRHGNTDYLGNRLAGRTPGVYLNKSGFDQAEKLAQNLQNFPLRAIHSSPLERTLQTARSVAEVQKLPVQVDLGLMELDYGSFQGKPFTELRQNGLWELVHTAPDQVRFPGGETLVEAQQRAVQALERIAGQYQDQDIVACFSHGDMISLALAHFLGMPLNTYQRLSIHTASVSVVQISLQKIKVWQINHLPDQTLYLPAQNSV